MPANSPMVVAKLDTIMATMIRAVSLKENLSRMSEARPLPVTMPMRAFISCTMKSRSREGTSTQTMP